MKISKSFGRIKNKKAFVAIIAGVAVLLIGTVIAFNNDLMIFTNLFHLGDDTTVFSETFESPNNWSPCQEIPKTATATNKNSTPRYARMKINEYWRTKDSTTSVDDYETTDLPLTWDDNGTAKSYAVINTQNDDKWELKSDGWYYYKSALAENETTDSLLKSVTLNCEARLVEDGTVTVSETSQTGSSTPTAYAEARYHMYITFQLSDEEWHPDRHIADCNSNILYDKIACQTNGLDTNVDFTTKSSASNGVGVNTFAAKANYDYPVYYYRGSVGNNNIIWGDFCWKIVRTTTTGGVKIIYNGVPVDNNGVKQCTNTAVNSALITVDMDGDGTKEYLFPFNNEKSSPADVGYMYGVRMPYNAYYVSSGVISYIFANDVSFDGTTYTLSADEGDYITGTWADKHLEASTRYHYFCTDGAAACDATKIGYIHDFNSDSVIHYLLIGGFANIEAAKAAMFANVYDSAIKATTETWFEREGLVSYENDLEDTVFCNDRNFYDGALISKDRDASPDLNPYASRFNTFTRIDMKNANGNYSLSLDCANKNDAFTKADTVNGNAKLRHKIGQITADELTMTGVSRSFSDSNAYLYSKTYYLWTASPRNFGSEDAYIYLWKTSLNNSNGTGWNGIRPMVSLKFGTRIDSTTNGTAVNPYVIEE